MALKVGVGGQIGDEVMGTVETVVILVTDKSRIDLYSSMVLCENYM